LRYVVPNDSIGGATFFIEHLYNYSVSNYVNGYPSTFNTGVNPWSGYGSRTVYVYGDILVQQIDSLGRIVWSRGIEKKQTSAEDGYYMGATLVQLAREMCCFIRKSIIQRQ
jgi:hypothetical protein